MGRGWFVPLRRLTLLTEAPTFTAFPNDTLISCEDWDLLDYLISGLFQVDFNDNCGIVDQTIDLDTLIGYCAAEREFQWGLP